MKLYTDIEQSNELLESGLSLETADMYWELDKSCNIEAYNLVPLIRYSANERKELFEKDKELIPCWSLAALLSVIQEVDDNIEFWSDHEDWHLDAAFYDVYSSSLVDACVEMIIKLKEEGVI